MKTSRTKIVVSLCASLTATVLAQAASDSSAPQTRFPVAHVRFEQNATDGDVEAVFEIIGRSEGLAKLTVVAPDGRTVINFSAPDASTRGIRQFVFESPEPTDVDALQAAYPAGVYTFDGATVSGAKLHGTATLSHTLPKPTSIVSPRPGARDVGIKNVKVAWAPVENVAGYKIEIEQAKSDNSLKTTLPGSASSFAVPEGFLVPGAKYQLGVATVSDKGNVSFVETHFATAAKN
jgi:Fibronectin type III domain